jgi:hypothetical protein
MDRSIRSDARGGNDGGIASDGDASEIAVAPSIGEDDRIVGSGRNAPAIHVPARAAPPTDIGNSGRRIHTWCCGKSLRCGR